MPIAKRGEQGGRQLLMLAAATVLGLLAMVWLFTKVGDEGGDQAIQVSIGDDVFLAGNVDRLAEDIEKLETPLLLGDVSGGDRDIFLQHIGDDDLTGWYAFGVRPLAATRDCFVEWQPDDATFIDNCDGTVYPSSGEGLPPYSLAIDADGYLTVDLRGDSEVTDTETSDSDTESSGTESSDG